MLRLLEQLRLVFQRQAQPGTGGGVVRPPGELNQATPTEAPAVAREDVAHAGVVHDIANAFRLPGVLLGQGSIKPGWPHQHQCIGAVVQVLHQVAQVARLMADLGQERRLAHPAVDLEAGHGPVYRRQKNARDWAGIGEDLQQLLLGNGHQASSIGSTDSGSSTVTVTSAV
ncbi:hypothetical protein D3C77_570060 [compost metagenome]